MIKALDRPFEDGDRRRAEVSIPSCVTLGLEDFVNGKTKQLFTKFEIDMSFMSSDPDEWNENCHFLDGLKKVKDIQVVNDNAERGVKLTGDFNGKIMRSESQRQCLLQVVAQHRKDVPDAKKSSLV